MRTLTPLLLLALLLSGCAGITARDRVKPPAPLPELAVQGEVTRLWSARSGAAGERHLRFAPRVVSDVIYIADPSGRVSALERATGERIWSIVTDLPLASGPGYGRGLILVGSLDGRLLALSAADGSEQWRSTLSGEILAPAAAAADIVIVRSSDGRLYGLNSHDGSQRWNYQRSVPLLTLRGTSAPVISGNLVLAGFDSGHLDAISLANGDLLWEIPVSIPSGRSELERLADIDGDPVVADDMVHVTGHRGSTLLARLDGRVLWEREIPSHKGLAVANWQVYVSDDEDRLHSLNRRSGNTEWVFDAMQRRAITAPAVAGEYVVVGDVEGYLHWFDRFKGELVARHRIDSTPIVATPVAVGETVYVTTQGGTLAALRLQHDSE